MASHHLDDHYAAVTGRGGMQSVERVHHHVNGRIESERGRRSFKIVVDCFGDTDAIDAGFLQLLRRHQRAVTADNNQCFYLKLGQYFFRICNYLCGHNAAIAGAGLGYEMAAIRRSDDRAAQRHDSINPVAIENKMIAGRKQSFKAVAKTNDLPTKFFSGEHNSAQHCVETWTIATAGKNTNPRLHVCNYGIRAIFLDRPDDRRQPIDRRVASHAVTSLRLHQIDSSCQEVRPLNDADTQFPSDPDEQLAGHDLHTESNTGPPALTGRF